MQPWCNNAKIIKNQNYYYILPSAGETVHIQIYVQYPVELCFNSPIVVSKLWLSLFIKHILYTGCSQLTTDCLKDLKNSYLRPIIKATTVPSLPQSHDYISGS